jgi:pilus assembly protein Flp/PilA
MRRFIHSVVRFLKADDGPTTVEYAVMLAFIIVICVGAITTIGTKTNSGYTTTNNNYPVSS